MVIAKLQNNQPITSKELEALEALLFTEEGAGTKDDFIKNYGEKPLGVFIRSVVGLSQEALNQAFSEFISTGQLTANQMKFVRSIIDYMAHNGTVERGSLVDEDPFTNLNDNGILGVFKHDEDKMFKVINIIDRINKNALAIA